LSGRPPFNDPIPKDLFERIAAGDYEMTDDPWPRISSDGITCLSPFSPAHPSHHFSAKDLISKLLVVDPAKRLTVRGALEHNWFCEVPKKKKKKKKTDLYSFCS
jgi:serine/threonine protein kinase